MTKKLLNSFRDEFFEKYGQRYPVAWGRDMKIIKNLLSMYDEDTVEDLISEYFLLNDDYVIRAGHPLTLLQNKVPKLLASIKIRKLETKFANSEDSKIIEEARKNVSENNDEDF